MNPVFVFYYFIYIVDPLAILFGDYLGFIGIFRFLLITYSLYQVIIMSIAFSNYC